MSYDRVAKCRKLSPPVGELPAAPIKISQKAKKSTSKKPVQSTAPSDPEASNSPAAKHKEVTLPSQEAQPFPSVKGFASSESQIRRANLKAVISYLENRAPDDRVSEAECLKLWRGFHIAIYMHDSKNQISVQNLVREIAGTFVVVAGKDADREGDEWLTAWHSTFWQTMGREWIGIDSHRMNKYLLLVRCVIREIGSICFKPLFEQDKREVVRESTMERVTGVVQTLKTLGPLNCTDRKIPDGLRLHFLDVIADEVLGVLGKLQDEAPNTEATKNGRIITVVEALRQPLGDMAKGDSGAQRHVRLKAREAEQAFKEKHEELANT